MLEEELTAYLGQIQLPGTFIGSPGTQCFFSINVTCIWYVLKIAVCGWRGM